MRLILALVFLILTGCARVDEDIPEINVNCTLYRPDTSRSISACVLEHAVCYITSDGISCIPKLRH